MSADANRSSLKILGDLPKEAEDTDEELVRRTVFGIYIAMRVSADAVSSSWAS